MAKQAKKQRTPAPKQKNGWDVLSELIQGTIGLINNNKVYPAFGLLLLGIVGLVANRLPPDDLAEITKLLIKDGSLLLLAALVASNLGWAYLLKRTRETYLKEIDRLASVRSELMHKDGSIKNHRSSNDDCDESYLLPDNEGAERK